MMEREIITIGFDESLIRQIQADRFKRNPNKIPFIPSFNIAEDDKATFKRYERYGERVIDSCIVDICEHNYLDHELISRKLFVKVANSLGFFDESKKKHNSYEG